MGIIGQMGRPVICPNCGKCDCMKWNPETDITTCLCGWNNEEDAKRNREKMIKNGEIREDKKLEYAIDTNGPKNLFLAWENDSDVYECLKIKIDELENKKGISTEYIQSVKSAFEDLKEGDIESAVNLLCAIMQKE